MDDYQSLLEGIWLIQQIMAAVNMSDSVVAEAQDQIGQVMRAPGERKQFAQMNTGRIRHTRYAEGIEFAMNAGRSIFLNLSGTELRNCCYLNQNITNMVISTNLSSYVRMQIRYKT